jgi:hypothetical protein
MFIFSLARLWAPHANDLWGYCRESVNLAVQAEVQGNTLGSGPKVLLNRKVFFLVLMKYASEQLKREGV